LYSHRNAHGQTCIFWADLTPFSLEAADLNTFANEGSPRLWGRAGSFCMERSGYQEAGANDQGIILFLPIMTWGEPPFYARKVRKRPIWLLVPPYSLNRTSIQPP
jgi:hypothetical protein